MNLTETAIAIAPSEGALFYGWLIAVTTIPFVITGTELHQRIAGWFEGDGKGTAPDFSLTTGRLVFQIFILLTLVIDTRTFNFILTDENLKELTSRWFEHISKLLNAGSLLLLAWITSKVVRIVATTILSSAGYQRILGRLKGNGKELLNERIGSKKVWVTHKSCFRQDNLITNI